MTAVELKRGQKKTKQLDFGKSYNELSKGRACFFTDSIHFFVFAGGQETRKVGVKCNQFSPND